MPYVNPKEKQFEEVPYLPFVDRRTGKAYPNAVSPETCVFWKPMADVLFEYASHPEAKSDGDVGILERKEVVVRRVRHIGKETNELEQASAMGVDGDGCTEYVDFRAIIMGMSREEAEKRGISRRNYFMLRKKYKEGKPFRINKSTQKRLHFTL